MAKNEFLTFGTAEGANVLSNEEYAVLAARVNGFNAGVARSRELNKTWRQSSVMTHVMAQFIADASGNDVLDDGDISKLKSSLESAIKSAIPETRDAALTEKGIVRLSNAVNSPSEERAATPAAVKVVYELASQAKDSATGALAKNQNGADIADKNRFINNLGLTETVKQAKNAVPASRKVNGKALTGDISLSAGDVGACTREEVYSMSVPPGVPLPWAAGIPPAGWVKCDGTAFDRAKAPGLLKLFPDGLTPDLRGMFIRGWDGGRLVDPGRALLSVQDSENKSHVHPMGSKLVWATPGSGQTDTGAGGSGWQYTGASGGSESRPRNIAFNYIMREIMREA